MKEGRTRTSGKAGRRLAGEEIPLAIQVVTDRQPVSDVQMEDFFRPEEYAAGGYECVYAVTAEFE